MQVERVEIDGFRRFAKLSAELGALTVIVGKNGVGKSSLFEALRIVVRGASDRVPGAEIAVVVSASGSSRRETHAPFTSLVMIARFYGEPDLAAMRRPAAVSANPILSDDGSNLSAVLAALALEHREALQEVECHMRCCLRDFRALGVRPCGPGQVVGFVLEEGGERALADLSDGTLRLLFWMVAALQPHPPDLWCCEEPEVGLHPDSLSTLAGLLRVASARSQILIATHSPYFLSQFLLEDIAVMRRGLAGNVEWVRPAAHEGIRSWVAERGSEEIVRLFVSGELEGLP